MFLKTLQVNNGDIWKLEDFKVNDGVNSITATWREE